MNDRNVNQLTDTMFIVTVTLYRPLLIPFYVRCITGLGIIDRLLFARPRESSRPTKVGSTRRGDLNLCCRNDFEIAALLCLA